jgi:hypothetical protein
VSIDAVNSALDDAATANSLPVKVYEMVQPSTVVAGQVSSTAAAVAFPANVAKSGVTIKAHASNTIPIFIGAAGSVTVNNGYQLSAGEAVFLEISNTNLIGVISTASGATACYLVS